MSVSQELNINFLEDNWSSKHLTSLGGTIKTDKNTKNRLKAYFYKLKVKISHFRSIECWTVIRYISQSLHTMASVYVTHHIWQLSQNAQLCTVHITSPFNESSSAVDGSYSLKIATCVLYPFLLPFLLVCGSRWPLLHLLLLPALLLLLVLLWCMRFQQLLLTNFRQLRGSCQLLRHLLPLTSMLPALLLIFLRSQQLLLTSFCPTRQARSLGAQFPPEMISNYISLIFVSNKIYQRASQSHWMAETWLSHQRCRHKIFPANKHKHKLTKSCPTNRFHIHISCMLKLLSRAVVLWSNNRWTASTSIELGYGQVFRKG